MALKINPLFEQVWFLKAFCEMYTGKLEDALDSFSRVLSINYDNSDAWNNIASILVKLDRL